jgi:hypothetical protein
VGAHRADLGRHAIPANPSVKFDDRICSALRPS